MQNKSSKIDIFLLEGIAQKNNTRTLYYNTLTICVLAAHIGNKTRK